MTKPNSSILISMRRVRGSSQSVLSFLLCLLVLSGGLVRAKAQLRFHVTDRSAPQGEAVGRVLELGKPIEREMVGGQSHFYQLAMTFGQFALVVVEQKGIDVVVKLFAPDGKLLIEVDSPNGTQGPESFSLIGEATGIYRLEVSSLEKDAKPGGYEAKLLELRSAAQQDRDRFAGRKAFDEGVRLHTQNTADSLIAALKKYEEAIELYRAAGDLREQFETLFNMSAAHRVMSELPKALDYANQALQIAQSLGDKSRQAQSLRHSLSLNRDSGKLEEALIAGHEALRLYRETGDKKNEAAILYNLGSIYRISGELEKALYFNSEALHLYRAAGERKEEAALLEIIGFLNSYLGDQQKAREHFDQALSLYKALGSKIGEAKTLHTLGYSYIIEYEYQKALDYFVKALAIWRLTENRAGEAVEHSSVSNEYARAGDRQKALFHAEQALVSQSLPDVEKGTVLTNVGHTYNKLGEFDKALAYYDEALRIWQTLGDKRGEAITLKHLAAAQRDQGRLAEAQVSIEKSISLLEFMRANAGSPEAQSSFVASLFDFYEFQIDLMMRLNAVNPQAGHDLAALAFTEKVKGRSLIELLKKARVELRQGVDGALLERERSLNELITVRLDDLAKLLKGKYTNEQKLAAEREIDVLKDKQRQAQADIRQRSPHYAALAEPQPLGVREIQQQVLDGNTTLLEYELGDERSYLWAVTVDGVLSYQLPPRAEVEAQARRVYQLLIARQPAPGLTDAQQRAREVAADAQYQTQATILSNMLLAPVAAQLGTKRLLIVADGALQYLPFAALPVPTTPGVETKTDPRPLILDHEIVSLPSASVLAVLRRELANRQPALKTVAVLADPVFSLDDARVKQSLASKVPGSSPKPAAVSSTPPSTLNRALRSVRGNDERASLQRLLFSRDEADAILSAVKPRQSGLEALDFRANRKMAMSDELGQYRIIHFSTHGLLDSRHPELSGLVLSLVDEAGQPQEGFLRLHEIYDLRLNADLVVLSACQTGLGKEVKGEGLIGLTRGFMYAGAPRVVASLWQVDDAATAELMKRFYRGVLQEKLPPAAALRAAQIEMLKKRQWQSPYYWGAFVLQGEWR
jgi:CHAT domain-containing protein/tetratricopeptide (TPR) repeat protein